MTDYIKKASEGDYEDYIDFLKECTDDKIEKSGMGLKEASGEIVSEAFDQLRDNRPVLNKLFAGANEVLEQPCKDDVELEQQILDTVIQEIHNDELYVSKKTGEMPDVRRLNF